MAAIAGDSLDERPTGYAAARADGARIPVSGLRDLAGKVAVVTGGASGIGRALAARLSAEGMRVVIADVEAAALARAAAELGAVGLMVDVADRASVDALAAAVTDRFGAVHVLCNNAGVASTAAIADMTADDWRWILGVNVWGVINGVAAFLPLLERNRDGGHIVNTASVAAFSVTPLHGAYCATKHAVIAFTETLALELEQSGSNVGVTALCPGPVSTNLGASSRNRPGAARRPRPRRRRPRVGPRAGRRRALDRPGSGRRDRARRDPQRGSLRDHPRRARGGPHGAHRPHQGRVRARPRSLRPPPSVTTARPGLQLRPPSAVRQSRR